MSCQKAHHQGRYPAVPVRRKPPSKRAVYRQLSFWAGTWDLSTADGKPAGRNIITLQEQGMLVTEHWTNTQGATGTSINFHDPSDGRWHQVWVDPTGEVTRYSRQWRDGAMRFGGTEPGKVVAGS